MTDDVKPNEYQDMIDAGMARARERREQALPSTGFCHWCQIPIGQGRLFCCRAHSDEHEQERQTLKELGL